jgi:hypothetical protein
MRAAIRDDMKVLPKTVGRIDVLGMATAYAPRFIEVPRKYIVDMVVDEAERQSVPFSGN